MITVILRDLRWRIAVMVLIAIALYTLEPGFHQHEEFNPDAVDLGPLGISAALAHFAGLSMIVLLAGFVSTDRREGYTGLYFAQPTSPLAFYSLRWGLAYLIAFGGAVLFLVIGQLIAWGAFHGGWRGLVLPALTALIYGGLVAFFSATLPRGDAWLVFLLFLPTFFPQILTAGLARATPLTRDAVMLLIPPQAALQEVWEGLLLDAFSWAGTLYSAIYGSVFLIAAAAVIRLRDWP